MRFRLIIGGAIAVGLCTVASAQKYAKVVWEHVVEDTLDSITYKCCVDIAGSDVIWIGERDYFAGSTVVFVERVNAYGSVVWSNTYYKPGEAYHFVQGADKTFDGNVVIMAKVSATDSRGEPGASYFLRIDPDGTLLAAADFGLGHNYISGIDVGVGGNIYLVYGQNFTCYSLVKLDSNFQHVWTRDLGDYQDDEIAEVDPPHIIPGGDILVASASGLNADVRLDRYSPNGTNVYSRTFGSGEKPRAYYSSTGNTYLGFLDTSGTNEMGRLIRLDAAGNNVWHMTDMSLKDVCINQLSTGDLIVSGAVTPGEYEGSFKVGRITEDGVAIWADVRPHNGREETKGFALAVGPDDLIYNIGTASNQLYLETWDVTCYSPTGVLLYDWNLLTYPVSISTPHAFVAEAGGELFVGGSVGDYAGLGHRSAQAMKLQAESKQPVIAAVVRRGSRLSGGFFDLLEADSSYYEIRSGPTTFGLDPISVELAGFVDPDYPANGFEFEVVSKGSRTGLLQVVELWNWRTSAWENRTLQPMTTTDQTTLTVGLAADNINPTSGAIGARISVLSNGHGRFYTVSLNKASWYVRP